MIRLLTPLALLLGLLCPVRAETATLYIVPNTHGTVSGWLVNFDVERNWVVNNYLDHLDRVKADPEYRFAYSEVPNLVSFLQFAPERLNELKQRIRERRVELTNGFFLEPDVNLSSGEALVQMGVQGLSWYQKVFGFRPRHCWMIDLTGCHQQMPQIVTGLGMKDLVYCRNNPNPKNIYWWEAPDGTRALTLRNGHYAELGGKDSLFGAVEPVTDAGFAKMREKVQEKIRRSPSSTSLLSLAGMGDYSLPPKRADYPSAFCREWNRRYPEIQARTAILSDYVDALDAELASGKTQLPTYHGDTGYTWEAFWMNMPEVRQYFRKDEHLLAAAELLSTAASLESRAAYPSQGFADSWINLLMNMDRNTLWGASAGMVFRDPEHWDAWDRFTSVEKQSLDAISSAARAITKPGASLGLLNALNWRRTDPVEIEPAAGKIPAKGTCQPLPGSSRITCQMELPAASIAAVPLRKGSLPKLATVALPASIETPYYSVHIDPRTGSIASLKLKSTGEELLGGPANVILMERAGEHDDSPEHFMSSRPKRRPVGSSSDFPARITTFEGPLATVVEIASDFPHQSKLLRRMTFYRNHPRIDFETRVELGTTNVLVSADFPLASAATGRTRAIPYGFSSTDPRVGKTESVLPAIRWSNYQLASGSGLALLDRGLTAHEFNPNTVTLVFLNAVAKYIKLSNPMLEGLGVREYFYSIVPHPGSWQQAGIPRLAYEFNSPVYATGAIAAAGSKPLVESSPNVIVEAVRRVGSQIELRLYETNGQAGTAEITVNLPHSAVTLTNMMGESPTPLAASAPNRYRFPVRPQQIVTLRLDTASAVAEPEPVRNWTRLAPESKRKALDVRIQGKGHPGGY